MNLLIKKVKRVGHGFRNFTNYRLRLLLHCGIRWQTHRTARLRGRHPRLVAKSRDTIRLGPMAGAPRFYRPYRSFVLGSAGSSSGTPRSDRSFWTSSRCSLT
jgi:hypothetical protein